MEDKMQKSEEILVKKYINAKKEIDKAFNELEFSIEQLSTEELFCILEHRYDPNYFREYELTSDEIDTRFKEKIMNIVKKHILIRAYRLTDEDTYYSFENIVLRALRQFCTYNVKDSDIISKIGNKGTVEMDFLTAKMLVAFGIIAQQKINDGIWKDCKLHYLSNTFEDIAEILPEDTDEIYARCKRSDKHIEPSEVKLDKSKNNKIIDALIMACNGRIKQHYLIQDLTDKEYNEYLQRTWNLIVAGKEKKEFDNLMWKTRTDKTSLYIDTKNQIHNKHIKKICPECNNEIYAIYRKGNWAWWHKNSDYFNYKHQQPQDLTCDELEKYNLIKRSIATISEPFEKIFHNKDKIKP